MVRNIDTGDIAKYVALVVLAVGLVFVAGNLFGGPLPSTASITSTLCGVSADQVRFSSNSRKISGESWVVEAVGACSDHIIEGGAKVSADSLKGTNSQGETVTAKRGFQLAMSSFSSYIYNPVRDRVYTEIYKVKKKKIEGSGATGGVTKADVQKCLDWQNSNSVSYNNLDAPDSTSVTEYDDYVTSSGALGLQETLHCFRAQNKAGEVRSLQSGSLKDFTSTWYMRAGGAEYTKKVSQQEADGGFTIGDGQYKAHVNYPGSLTTQVLDTNIDTGPSGYWKVSCDNACNQPANSQSWYVVSQNYIDYYRRHVENFEQKVEQNTATSSGAVSDVNNGAQLVLSDHSEKLANSIGDWVDRVKIVNNQLRVYARNSDALGRPTFTIRVDADWLGFNVPVAKPKIQSIQSITMDAQTDQFATVTVRNTADVGGRVQAGLTCPAPISGGSSQQYIPAGGTASYDLRVSVGPSADKTYSCTVKVKDVDAGSVQATGTMSVTVRSSCDDSDGDGVCNTNDGCIDRRGPASNGGCPITGEDSDGDGVPNDQDQCSGTPSSAAVNSNGCQIHKSEDQFKNGCTNSVDDDSDGLIDRRDSDCQGTDGGFPVIPVVIGVVVAAAVVYYRNVIISSLPAAGGGSR